MYIFALIWLTLTSSSMILLYPLWMAISRGVWSLLLRIVLSAPARKRAVMERQTGSTLIFSLAPAKMCKHVLPSLLQASSAAIRSSSVKSYACAAITSIAVWKKVSLVSEVHNRFAAKWSGVPFPKSLWYKHSDNRWQIFLNFGFISLVVNLGRDLYKYKMVRWSALSDILPMVVVESNPLLTIHSSALHLPKEAAQWMSGRRLAATGSGTVPFLSQPTLSYFSMLLFSVSRLERWPSWSVQLTIAWSNSWCSGHSTVLSQKGVHFRQTTVLESAMLCMVGRPLLLMFLLLWLLKIYRKRRRQNLRVKGCESCIIISFILSQSFIKNHLFSLKITK